MPYPTLTSKVTRIVPGRYKVVITFNGEPAPSFEILRQGRSLWVQTDNPQVTSKTKQALVHQIGVRYVNGKTRALRATPNRTVEIPPRKSLALTQEQANEVFDVLVAEWDANPEDRATFLQGFQEPIPIDNWLCAPGRRWRQGWFHFATTYDASSDHLVEYQAVVAWLALEKLYVKFFGG